MRKNYNRINEIINKINYFNILKRKLLIKHYINPRKTFFFTFLSKRIVFDNKHLANKNLIQWCVEKGNFKKISPISIEFFYEKKEMKVFEKLIKDSNYFLDIGAQSGIYSLAAYLSKNIKKIISVEITKEYINAIKNNIRINSFNLKKFKILNLALGNGKICHEEWISKTMTLGHAFDEILNIANINITENDTIKIDIEGWEFCLALEVGQIFKTVKPNLILSLHKNEIKKLSNNAVTENEIFNFLSDNYNYKYMPDKNRILKEVGSLRDYKLEVENYKTIIFSNKKF